jgi:hypothetical protein
MTKTGEMNQKSLTPPKGIWLKVKYCEVPLTMLILMIGVYVSTL